MTLQHDRAAQGRCWGYVRQDIKSQRLKACKLFMTFVLNWDTVFSSGHLITGKVLRQWSTKAILNKATREYKSRMNWLKKNKIKKRTLKNSRRQINQIHKNLSQD